MKLNDYIKKVLEEVPYGDAITFEISLIAYPNGTIEVSETEETGNKIKFTVTKL